MILKFVRTTPQFTPLYKFSSASAAAIDYYSLLGVPKGATTEQIHQAFKNVSQNINPQENSTLFSKINEAFVILSDGKARDAYDSLARTINISYINKQQPTHSQPQSYIADRKANKHKQFAKKYNIDQFGRYKGGVPRPGTLKRGSALGQVGELYHASHIYNKDMSPDYSQVDAARAQSFKNFHQDERIHRTAKKPWTTLQVDYDFFSIKKFLDKFTLWKYVIFFSLVLPILLNVKEVWLGLATLTGDKVTKKAEKKVAEHH